MKSQDGRKMLNGITTYQLTDIDRNGMWSIVRYLENQDFCESCCHYVDDCEDGYACAAIRLLNDLKHAQTVSVVAIGAPYIDDYIREGNDADALRYLANELYNSGKIGGTRKALLERAAERMEK